MPYSNMHLSPPTYRSKLAIIRGGMVSKGAGKRILVITVSRTAYNTIMPNTYTDNRILVPRPGSRN
jgi:hypothetical protein